MRLHRGAVETLTLMPHPGRMTLPGVVPSSLTRQSLRARQWGRYMCLLSDSWLVRVSSFQLRAATHTMAIVVATSMTEKYR